MAVRHDVFLLPQVLRLDTLHSGNRLVMYTPSGMENPPGGGERKPLPFASFVQPTVPTHDPSEEHRPAPGRAH